MSNIHFIPEEEVFDKYTIINNKSYSEHLTSFLKSKHENGYVLNLNAEWGAGKTTFLKCWYNQLRKEHPVVYFDAWKSDFTKDPMLALMDAFHQQLISELSTNQKLLHSFLSKGSHFIKSALPSLLVGYLKNKGGMNSEDSLLTSASETFDISEGDLSDALKDTMKAMLNQKKRVDGVDDFKGVLVELSEVYTAANPKSSLPVFVLIDELDRCRPTYAIEVIECVKHFFNTKNFIFILATDTNQLQHSIKSIYGSNFDSLTYLSRFFNNSATLPAPNKKEYIEMTIKSYLINEELHEKVLDLIDSILEWHLISSLREIQKTINIVDIAISQSKSYSLISLILFSLLKRRYPNHYEELMNVNINPYYGKFRTNDINKLSGKYTKIMLTKHTSVSVEEIFHIVASGSWRNHTPKHIDEYQFMKLDGLAKDQAISALIIESLTLTNQDVATMEEHFKLIEFAGFFQS